jgi:CRISPR/Cas system-associated protein Cas5 (RAMP superfamily)
VFGGRKQGRPWLTEWAKQRTRKVKKKNKGRNTKVKEGEKKEIQRRRRKEKKKQRKTLRRGGGG